MEMGFTLSTRMDAETFELIQEIDLTLEEATKMLDERVKGGGV
jgi:hypothetical protein